MSAVASPFRQMGSDRIDPVLVGLWITLLILALIWVAPAVFIVSTSLKSTQEVMSGSAFAPPAEFYWQNYGAAWERGRFSTTFVCRRWILCAAGIVAANSTSSWSRKGTRTSSECAIEARSK